MFSFTPSSFTAGVEVVVTVTVTNTVAGHRYQADAQGSAVTPPSFSSPAESSGGSLTLTIDPFTPTAGDVDILVVDRFEGEFQGFCAPETPSPDDPDVGTGPVEGGAGLDPTAIPGLEKGDQPDNIVVSSNFAASFLSFGIGIAGGIAFLLMIFGAYRLMFAAGNPESVQQGQQIITAAIAGLLVIVFASFILRFIGFTILGLGGF